MSDDPFRDRPDDPAPDRSRQPSLDDGDPGRGWEQHPPPAAGDESSDWGHAPPPPPPDTGYDENRGWQDPPPRGYDPAAGWGNEPVPAGGRPASVGKRAGAFVIDAFGLFVIQVIVGVIVGVGAAVSGVGGDATGAGSYLFSLLLGIIVPIAYFALMEANSGQTIGKMLLGIKAVSADGGPLTLQQGVVRRLPFYALNIIPLIGWLATFALGIAIIVTAMQDEPAHQGLHDKWAKTRVVDA